MLLAFLLQAAACPAVPAPPPTELVGWSSRTAVAASSSGETPLNVGRAVRATLLPAATVKLAIAPGRPAATASSSGVFAFTAANAGRYRVALSAGAWLDVVSGGKALASVNHGHGPACTGIRKMVDFDLQPGRHLLQIVGSPTPTIDAMVVRVR